MVPKQMKTMYFDVVTYNVVTTDNEESGLKTQTETDAASVIRFTLEPWNFILNLFQDF